MNFLDFLLILIWAFIQLIFPIFQYFKLLFQLFIGIV